MRPMNEKFAPLDFDPRWKSVCDNPWCHSAGTYYETKQENPRCPKCRYLLRVERVREES